MTDNAHSPEWT